MTPHEYDDWFSFWAKGFVPQYESDEGFRLADETGCKCRDDRVSVSAHDTDCPVFKRYA